MKRITAFILTVCLFAAVTCGCGGNDAQSGFSEPAESINNTLAEQYGDDPNADYEVEGNVSVGVNMARYSDFELLIDSFKELYPNIELDVITFETGTDDATEYLTSLSMAEKKLPDILYDDAGSIPTYISNSWAYPLNEFLTDEDTDDSHIPENIINNLSYNGRLYALPQTLHFNGVVVNTDLVDELNIDVPEFNWNWNDFSDFLKKTTTSKYSGIEIIGTAINWMSGSMSDGLTVSGYNPQTRLFELSDSVLKAINYVKEIRSLHSVEAWSLRGAGGTQSDYAKKFSTLSNITDSYAAFNGGLVASRFAGTWSYGEINSNNLEFNWEYFPVPQETEGRLPMHVDYCWMTTGVTDENKAAAWEFLRFITYSREGNLIRLSAYDEENYDEDSVNQTFYIPCTTEPSVLEKFESLPMVTEAILYMYDNIGNSYFGDPEKTVPGFDFVYDFVLDEADRAINGQTDFTAKMGEIQSKANNQITQYWSDFEANLKDFEDQFG